MVVTRHIYEHLRHELDERNARIRVLESALDILWHAYRTGNELPESAIGLIEEMLPK